MFLFFCFLFFVFRQPVLDESCQPSRIFALSGQFFVVVAFLSPKKMRRGNKKEGRQHFFLLLFFGGRGRRGGRGGEVGDLYNKKVFITVVYLVFFFGGGVTYKDVTVQKDKRIVQSDVQKEKRKISYSLSEYERLTLVSVIFGLSVKKMP